MESGLRSRQRRQYNTGWKKTKNEDRDPGETPTGRQPGGHLAPMSQLSSHHLVQALRQMSSQARNCLTRHERRMDPRV